MLWKASRKPLTGYLPCYDRYVLKAPNGLNRWFGGPNRFKLRLYKWLVVGLKAKRFKPLTNDLTTG